jgi:hypothetical protein
MVLNQPPLLLVVECKFLVLFAILRPTVRKMCHFSLSLQAFHTAPSAIHKENNQPALNQPPTEICASQKTISSNYRQIYYIRQSNPSKQVSLFRS